MPSRRYLSVNSDMHTLSFAAIDSGGIQQENCCPGARFSARRKVTSTTAQN